MHIKKRKTEGEKEDCFSKLVINVDQHLNEALTLLGWVDILKNWEILEIKF